MKRLFFKSIFRRLHIYSKPKAIIMLTEWLQPFSIRRPISFHLSVILKYQAVMHTKLTVLKVLKYIEAY